MLSGAVAVTVMRMTSTERIGIVGAGILGLATARSLLQHAPGLRVTMLEKEPAVACHQTGRNSNVVHAGIYYKTGSLKAELCVAGAKLLRAYCEEHGLAYAECGKLIVAATPVEIPQLRVLLDRGNRNGVSGLRWLEAGELQDVEPHVAGFAGIHSPHTAIVDYREIARNMARELEERGATIRTGARVVAIDEVAGEVRVSTTAGAFTFDRLLSCAGLQSDDVARLSGDPAEPRIVPFRGDYFALKPSRTHLVNGMIYPVPDPRYPFLGVHLTRQVDGSVTVGPNAVLAFAKEGYRFWHVRPGELARTLRYRGFHQLARVHWRTGLEEMVRALDKRRFVAEARRYVPALMPGDVVRHGAGIRAQAVGPNGELVDDFHITHRGRVVNVRNAPSPAATSSLAIGSRIAGMVLDAARTG